MNEKEPIEMKGLNCELSIVYGQTEGASEVVRSYIGRRRI